MAKSGAQRINRTLKGLLDVAWGAPAGGELLQYDSLSQKVALVTAAAAGLVSSANLLNGSISPTFNTVTATQFVGGGAGLTGIVAGPHTHVSADITDATSANAANMIVKRDGSGNFAAARGDFVRVTASGGPSTFAGPVELGNGSTLPGTITFKPSSGASWHHIDNQGGQLRLSTGAVVGSGTYGNISSGGILTMPRYVVSDGTNQAIVSYSHNGLSRFAWYTFDGTNMSLSRYDNSGVYVNDAISVSRANGTVNLSPSSGFAALISNTGGVSTGSVHLQGGAGYFQKTPASVGDFAFVAAPVASTATNTTGQNGAQWLFGTSYWNGSASTNDYVIVQPKRNGGTAGDTWLDFNSGVQVNRQLSAITRSVFGGTTVYGNALATFRPATTDTDYGIAMKMPGSGGPTYPWSVMDSADIVLGYLQSNGTLVHRSNHVVGNLTTGTVGFSSQYQMQSAWADAAFATRRSTAQHYVFNWNGSQSYLLATATTNTGSATLRIGSPDSTINSQVYVGAALDPRAKFSCFLDTVAGEPAGDKTGGYFYGRHALTTAYNGFALVGVIGRAQLAVGATTSPSSVRGVGGQADHLTSGVTLPEAIAVNGQVAANAGGAITAAYNFMANSPGLVDSGTNIASIGAQYGIFIQPQKMAGVGTGYGVYQNGANDFNYFNGVVGMGIFNPSNTRLGVSRTMSAVLSANQDAGNFQIIMSPTNGAETTYLARGLAGSATSAGTNAISGQLGLRGVQGTATVGGNHATVSIAGVVANVANNGTATTNDAYNFYAFQPSAPSGTITNAYGLYVVGQKVTGVTNGWGVYQAGTADKNRFDGMTGFGLTPAYAIDVLAAAGLQARFRASGANAGGIEIDNGTAGLQSIINFRDAGTLKWLAGKQTDNTFILYDSAGAKDVLRVSSSNFGIAPAGGSATVGGSPSQLANWLFGAQTSSTATGDVAAAAFQILSSPAAANTGTVIGLDAQSGVSNGNAQTHNLLAGVMSRVQHRGSGAVTGTYMFRATSPGISGTTAGSIGTANGLYIDAQKASGVTTGYGVYQAGTTDYNYFGGRVGIGNSVPSGPLHVESATAGGARMRIAETGDTADSHYSGIELHDGATFKGGLFKNGLSHDVVIWDGSAGRIWVRQGGNVGIGAQPSVAAGSEVLQIAGSAKYTGQAVGNKQTLTDAATITWNVDNGDRAVVTLGGNRTLALPTNLKDGSVYQLIVKQDATGGRTLAYAAGIKWAGGTPPTLSTGANAVDVLTFVADGTSTLYGVPQLNFA